MANLGAFHRKVKKPPVDSTSWSLSGTDTDIVYDYALSITDFSRKMLRMKKEEAMDSGVFSVYTKNGKVDWYLRCYPNGKELESFVSLYLSLQSEW